MEFHMTGEPEDVSRYVFCPGSQSRARQIAEHFEGKRTVSEERGIVVYSGSYRGVFMTACGTGMGGPATAIATEELGHLGADTFIRVGSCGVLQPGYKPGDVIIASGTVRLGGTGKFYLPPEFPAVPTFDVTSALVAAAEQLEIPVTVGVGIAGDGFYGSQKMRIYDRYMEGNPLFIEMESDALFIVGRVRGWRTGALFASDGAPGETKPEWGHEAFARGTDRSIRIALEAMTSLAVRDQEATAS
jgi:uridine phosphorylase